MPRDYKNRASSKKQPQAPQQGVVWWKWLLIFLLIALFVVFLFFLSHSNPKTEKQVTTVETKIKAKKKPEEPRYDFYTILPETEIVVPDYEINTRSREEQLGKRKESKYIVQAGSFRQFIEADRLRARLALMGIESRVEKATVGNAVWNRVKMGPYKHSSSISVIKKRLKQNGIDVIVTEIKR